MESIWQGSGVTRITHSAEESDLFDLACTFAVKELDPIVDAYERQGLFPREVFRSLGATGLLTLPFAHVINSDTSRIPYRVSLQVLEEIARSWLTVAVSISVHNLACSPILNFGTPSQKALWTEWILGGESLGAYCLSEPQSGSDAGALQMTATKEGDSYLLNGTKAWITHGGVADFYTVFARTGPEKVSGISCFFVPANTPGLVADQPESKMALNSSPTAQIRFDNVRVPTENRIGEEGEGYSIALASLDVGRLGIAACAVGIGQAALDLAANYSRQRHAFGKPIGDFQGVSFMLADMATSIQASRSLYLEAARLNDLNGSVSSLAAMSKLLSTDSCMKVTTDAVQVLGGNGYTSDYRAERFMREAKVLQIVEGTNQIQRLVIARELERSIEK